MHLSHTKLRRAFLKYNELYFDNKLPLDTDVLFRPLDGKHACCDFTDRENHIIEVDTMRAICRTLWKQALLHEMAHISSGDCTHGRRWQAEIDRLYTVGAFKGLL